MQTPLPQTLKTLRVLLGRFKALKEPREGRLTADALQIKYSRQQDIASQMRCLRQLLGSGQDPHHEAQRHIPRQHRVWTSALGQGLTQNRFKLVLMQESGQWAQPSVRRNLLIGEPYFDGFLAGLEFNQIGH